MKTIFSKHGMHEHKRQLRSLSGIRSLKIRHRQGDASGGCTSTTGYSRFWLVLVHPFVCFCRQKYRIAQNGFSGSIGWQIHFALQISVCIDFQQNRRWWPSLNEHLVLLGSSLQSVDVLRRNTIFRSIFYCLTIAGGRSIHFLGLGPQLSRICKPVCLVYRISKVWGAVSNIFRKYLYDRFAIQYLQMLTWEQILQQFLLNTYGSLFAFPSFRKERANSATIFVEHIWQSFYLSIVP